MIHFVVPAYNEAGNIAKVLSGLEPYVAEWEARVILVDDGSDDGTAEIAREAVPGLAPEVVRHRRNFGVGVALNSGLRHALGGAGDDDAIVTLEADNTSDPSDVRRLLDVFDEGFDVVLASVYAPGGRLVGVSRTRVLASRAVSDTFRLLGGLREIHTLSSIFRVYRSGTLRRAADTYGYLLVREPGFAASVELLLKLRNAGARIAEVPTVNDWTRKEGSSKLPARPTLAAYGRTAAAHLLGRIQPPPMSPLADITDPTTTDES